ncbi:MAG TPA: asparagine synthase-related protein, partial [Pirellulales bacterium]|nr:asparagine synthase-related protein [Pirellulales bacterium]
MRPTAEPLSPQLAAKRDALLARLGGYVSCAVAYSGGVDSAVVAQAAFMALGDRAVAVTGVSASLAEGELQAAAELAAHIGIRHQVLATEEFADPNYVRNAADRCFHCKTELYTRLAGMTEKLGVQVVVNGLNL